ncbi:MAG: coproporphyrinogen dehydrogenase HemZ [Lachnospiraceae bacterium]|nr:coproporphyrinogen dehydrogenase HemZ [Lachnospiraceae bacterium]
MKILLSSPRYEYDIRGLLQAYFPWEKFSTDAEDPDPDCLSVRFEEAADPLTGNDLATLRFTHGDYDRTETVALKLEDVGTAKSALKRTLYRMLSEATGKTLPWGTLSGIRPTKIAMDLLNRGADAAEILRHMKEDLLVSDRKALLALEIAGREKQMLERLSNPGISLYIGIPFCPSTCLYCSFSSVTIGAYRKRIPEYSQAVSAELDLIKDLFPETPIHTVYFGGGTPTSLEADELRVLLRKVQETFDLSETVEWTVEAGRPDSVTEEKLAMLREFPVNRISVNPQTLHQKTLDLIGRKHTVEDFYRAFAEARNAGFTNINTDLILGLPGETPEDMIETVRGIAGLRPDSVTVHSLAIKRSSRLNLMKETYEHYRMENSEELMESTEETLREAGLRPYYLYRQKNMAGNLENVGYALPGKECYYNVLIMEETETIAAAGAGASTKKVANGRIDRAANAHDVETYLKNLAEMMDRKRKLFAE